MKLSAQEPPPPFTTTTTTATTSLTLTPHIEDWLNHSNYLPSTTEELTSLPTSPTCPNSSSSHTWHGWNAESRGNKIWRLKISEEETTKYDLLKWNMRDRGKRRQEHKKIRVKFCLTKS
ncbi:hypothetical protein E2C01_081627 [Portunus trituberculatus]|uniref:Uncharacterized protein n=1 Tax=Portunus trituberculatus TaxID=210409 RepID=A0A5B7IQ97_PORTR|nr:hypothetical protein [Portunus trituberculatus]